MKNNIGFICIIFSILLLNSGCEDKKKTASQPSSSEVAEKKVTVPSFNADSAYLFVKKQVDFGPRVPNTPAHRKCGKYLEEKFKELGLEVVVQSFNKKAYNGTELALNNIIASTNPAATKRIIVASHWDTRPYADQDSENQKQPIDGANDGASGVGVILELARIIQTSEVKPEVGLDFILFDGEDYGQPDFAEEEKMRDSWCLGSQYWSENMHKPGYSAYYGILLDMVGAKNAKFAMEGTSMHYAPSVVQKVWNMAHSKGFANHFIFQQSPPIIDDHTYVNDIARIPMIDIIEYNAGGDNYFGDYWHTHDDDMSIIDPATLKAVGQTVLEVLYRE